MGKSSIKGRIVHCDIRLLEGSKEKMPEREREGNVGFVGNEVV